MKKRLKKKTEKDRLDLMILKLKKKNYFKQIDNRSPEVLINQLSYFYQKGMVADHYEKGYTLSLILEDCVLLATYKKSKYVIDLVEENQRYYWYLMPYKSSYFKTEVDLKNGNLEMVLFALYENETIHNSRNFRK